jgi:23S rRNA pseudouridine1911/1915/1917 synthase
MTDEVLPAALDGQRLDRVVALLGALSRSQAGALIDEGSVSVNGAAVTVRSHRLAAGDSLVFVPPEPVSAVPGADPTVVVPVVFEDEHVIVVDKPAGLVVHPGAGNRSGTLVNGLLARYPELAVVGSENRPGIVHRLDRGTSGLLVVARTDPAHEALVRQIAERSVERVYAALVWGSLDEGAGVVDAPLGRSRRDPLRMTVSAEGREARTHYRVRRRFGQPASTTLLEVRLETGRTHQIRVHLTAIDHPVVGDQRYSGARPSIPLDRPFLHAERLAFDHPVSGARVEFESPLPDDLAEILGTLD